MKERKRRGIIPAVICLVIICGIYFCISNEVSLGKITVSNDLSIDCPDGWNKECRFDTDYYFNPREHMEYEREYMNIRMATVSSGGELAYDNKDAYVGVSYYMPLDAKPGDSIRKNDKKTYEKLFNRYVELKDDMLMKDEDISFVKNDEGDLYLKTRLVKDYGDYVYFRPVSEGFWIVETVYGKNDEFMAEAEAIALSMKDTEKMRNIAIRKMQNNYADFALLKDEPDKYPIPDLAYRNRNLKIFIPLALVVLLIAAIVIGNIRSRKKKDEWKSYRPKVMVDIKCEKCGKVFQKEAEKGSEEFVRNTYRLCPDCYRAFKQHQEALSDKMGQFTVH